jgi:hypothetical protein
MTRGFRLLYNYDWHWQAFTLIVRGSFCGIGGARKTVLLKHMTFLCKHMLQYHDIYYSCKPKTVPVPHVSSVDVMEVACSGLALVVRAGVVPMASISGN